MNKSYFLYLLKSKKYLLFFILLLNVLFVFSTSSSTSTIVSFIVSMFACFIVPCDVFFYLHNKKAIDMYYSLPIKRKELLTTGLIFSLIVCFIPFALVVIFQRLLYADIDYMYVIYLLVSVLTFALLIVFNTLVYSLANSIVDGVIVIGSYTLLPIIFDLVISYFIDVYVYGFTYDFTLSSYISPIYINIVNFIEARIGSFKFDLTSFLIVILLLSVLTILTYKAFVNRKVERAGSTSGELFAYPFIIYFYTAISILSICFGLYGTTSMKDFLSDNFILFVLVFALFVIAHFIYKRKFYFNVKMPAIFIAITLLCIGFAYVSNASNGFKLAYKYNEPFGNGNKPTYEYYQYSYSYEDGDSDPIIKYLNDKYNENTGYVQIEVNAYSDDDKLFKNMRDKSIEKHYEYNQENDYVGTLNIYSNRNSNSDINVREYCYSSYDYLDFDDLLKLAKEGADVTIYTDYHIYQLTKDGKLKINTTYEADKYAYDYAYDEGF